MPKLLKDDYNTCEAIVKNYSFNICPWDGDRLFASAFEAEYFGDTVKVCGYFGKNCSINHNNNCNTIELVDDSCSAGFSLRVNLDHRPDDLKIGDKCYVIGRIKYFELQIGFATTNIKPWWPLSSKSVEIFDVQEFLYK